MARLYTLLMHAVNYPFDIREGSGLIQDEEQFIKAIPFTISQFFKILESIKR